MSRRSRASTACASGCAGSRRERRRVTPAAVGGLSAQCPFASLAGAQDEPAVSPDRFQRADDAWPGHWAAPPRPWDDPERRLQSLEARERLRLAIGVLPAPYSSVHSPRALGTVERHDRLWRSAPAAAAADIERQRVAAGGRDGPCLMRWRRTRRGMTCHEVAARVTEYLDGALSATDRPRFEAHLEQCGDCRASVAQFAHTLNAIAALRADDAAPDGLDALLEAFRARAR